MKRVRGARKAMTIAERGTIADSAVRRVASLRSDPWRFNEELPPPCQAIGHGSLENYHKRPE